MAITLAEAKPYIQQATVAQAGQQAGLKQQVQQLSQAAPAGTVAPGKEQIQALAGETTKAQAAPTLEAQKQAAAAAQAARAQQAQEIRLQKVGVLQKQKQDLAQLVTTNEERLSNFNVGIKHELFDKQMRIQKDKFGRSLFTNQQLMDWAALKAKNEEDFKRYQSTAEQMIRRKEQVLDQALRVIQQDLEQRLESARQQGNHELEMTLVKLEDAAKRRAAEAKAKAAAEGSLWAIGGTIVGIAAAAVVTIYSGGTAAPAAPAIIAAGAGLGQAAGQYGYSKYGKEPTV